MPLTAAEKIEGLSAAARARTCARAAEVPTPSASVLLDLHIAAGLALSYYGALLRDMRAVPTGDYLKESAFRAALDMERMQHRAAVLMAQHFTPTKGE
jgi:hypothetical protein